MDGTCWVFLQNVRFSRFIGSSLRHQVLALALGNAVAFGVARGSCTTYSHFTIDNVHDHASPSGYYND